MREKRKKVWIDTFQTRLFLRIAIYFVVYQAAVWALVGIERRSYAALEAMLGEDPAALYFYLAVGVVGLVGLLFIHDAVVFTHRIVGPLYRFRKTVQAIVAGEEVDLVRLRDGDFLQDMKDEFNAMIKLLEERGAVVVKPAVPKEQPKDQQVPVG